MNTSLSHNQSPHVVFKLHKLIFQNANVGAGPITVTMNREKVVDFTNPIYSFEAVSVRLKPPGPPDDLQVGILKTVKYTKTLSVTAFWLGQFSITPRAYSNDFYRPQTKFGAK